MLLQLRRGSGGNLKGPAIVFVNSFAARIPLKNMSAYTAAKYALQGWTVSWGGTNTWAALAGTENVLNLLIGTGGAWAGVSVGSGGKEVLECLSMSSHEAAAALTLQDVLRAELSGSGIFVGAVHPGMQQQCEVACALQAPPPSLLIAFW